MTSHPRFLLSAGVVAVALTVSLWARAVFAADSNWTNTTGGLFNTAGNWSAGLPGTADIANFTLNNTYTVGFTANVTNTDLDVENGNVTFDLGGFTYSLTSATGVDVGNVAGQTGRLTVTNGILSLDTNADNVTVATQPGSAGFLTVTTGGQLGTAALRPDVIVGRSGTGTLTVNENGRIDGRDLVVGDFVGVTGTMTITGRNAVVTVAGLTRFGDAGTGAVSVTNGGTLSSAGSNTLGNALGAHGTATVSGAGSSWTMSAFPNTIGASSEGTLMISSGGLVSSAVNVTLGDTATGVGTATVTGAGSRWNLSGSQTIGASGLGVMVVSGGGHVNTVNVTALGGSAGGEGRVTVSGAGSQWTLSTITIGGSGTADLTVSAGGEVSAGGDVILGTSTTGSGVMTVTGAGSKLTTGGLLNIGTFGNGTLNVASDAEVYVGADLNVLDRTGSPIGTLNLGGGSIFVASDFSSSGIFNFTDGLLQVKGNFQPGAAAGDAILIINGADSDDLPTLDLIGAGTTNISALFVGNNHGGQLLLRQGRVVNNGNNQVNIGALTGSEGTLSVQNGAQFLTLGALAVGGSGLNAGGTGTLDISGGTVDANVLRLFSSGTINLNGGTLAVNTTPVLDGQFNWTSGTLRFDAAFSLTSDNVPKLLGLDATLGPGQALTSAAGQAVTLQTPIVVHGGTLSASSLINQSRLEVRSGSIGAVQNEGLILGDGVISGAVTNSAAGTIRVDAGKSLFFTGAVAPNAGELNLQGGTLDFTGPVINGITGRINGRGTLNFDGGLTNQGKMQFSGGPTDIYGNVSFTGGAGGGEMINSGGANVVTFYGNVTHNGDEIRTSPTNTTVFFGNVTGAGPFTGTGAVRFEGTFMPGNSPAIVPVEGNLQFGAASHLVMELAGTTAGAQYDQLHVGGLLSLDGALDVTLLNGFTPRYGDTFDLLDFAALAGRFDMLNLPPLDAGLAWDTSALYSTGAISAVPEPPAWLLAVVILALGLRFWPTTKNSH